MTSSPLTINHKPKRHHKLPGVTRIHHNGMIEHVKPAGLHGREQHSFEHFHVGGNRTLSILGVQHDGEDNSETRTA